MWVGTMIGYGRQTITTPYREITPENVIEVLQSALGKFMENVSDCNFLIDYYYGKQPLKRKDEKKVMEWIDFQNVDNVAQEVTDFWTAFSDGIPITLIQRGDVETGKSEGIAKLNNQYAMTGIDRATNKMAFYKQITGLVYTHVDINNEWEEGEPYIVRNVLDPRCAFVVRSAYYLDKRVMLGVTANMDDDNVRYFTAYSKDYMFIIKAMKIVNPQTNKDEWKYSHMDRSGEPNPLKRIPINEWLRTEDRTGVFECKIPSMDNLNLLSSDISNGVQQGIEAFWWTNDVELEKKEVTDEDGNVTLVEKKPQPGDWLHTNTLRNGSKPSIQSLTLDYHIADMVSNYLSQRAIVLQQCHVPQRNDNSGSSSGLAMDSASGWADAENIASAQECITKGCQMEELRIALSAIKESPYVDPTDPMLELLPSDIEPSIRRPRNYELLTRVNAFAALISKGASIEDSLAAAPIVPDASQFVARSGEGIRKYQEANVWKSSETKEESTHLPDNETGNVANSPLIDGITTGYEKDVEEDGRTE